MIFHIFMFHFSLHKIFIKGVSSFFFLEHNLEIMAIMYFYIVDPVSNVFKCLGFRFKLMVKTHPTTEINK